MTSIRCQLISCCCCPSRGRKRKIGKMIKYCMIEIDGNKFDLMIKGFHVPGSFEHNLTFYTPKSELNISVYRLSNILITLKVDKKIIKRIEHPETPKDSTRHDFTINTSAPCTEFTLTLHKTRLRRLCYCLSFMRYHPLIWKFTLRNNTHLLDYNE